MSKHSTKKWRIADDRLCVTGSFGENCYAVWKRDKAVKLFLDGSALSLDGFVK